MAIDWETIYIAVKCELPEGKFEEQIRTEAKAQIIAANRLEGICKVNDPDESFADYADEALMEVGILLRLSLKMARKFKRTLPNNTRRLESLPSLEQVATKPILEKIYQLATEIQVTVVQTGETKVEGGIIFLHRSDLLKGEGATYLSLCHEFGHVVDFGLRKMDGGLAFLQAIYPAYRNGIRLDAERFADAFAGCLFTAIQKDTNFVLSSAQNAFGGDPASEYYPRGDERVSIVAESAGRAVLPN